MEVAMSKKHVSVARITFGSENVQSTPFSGEHVEKVHAVVAQSTFGSEHVESARGSDHFLTIRWRFHVENVHAVVARSTK